MKSALILYPHQLYDIAFLPQVDTVVMVEEPLYFGVDQEFPLRVHKQKLILLRASMRRYAEEVLWPRKINVDYIELDVFMKSGDVLTRLKKFDRLFAFDPVDEVLTRRILAARREHPDLPAVEFLPTPNFYLKEHEVRQYFAGKHRQPFTEFYQWQRERFNVLIGPDYKPVGGKWSYEAEARTKLPKDQPLPTFGVFGDNPWVKDSIEYVDRHFPNNPGSTDFIWPTNHAEAQKWLQDFVAHRLDNFAPYQDALDKDVAWGYHSALASSINIGLLTPQEVIEAALVRHEKAPVPLASLEAFIRQVLGWREFIRGQYVMGGTQMRTANVFGHKRRLSDAWYDGTLGIPPFDDLIKKITQHAYAHQAERLMVAGNLMVLCEIDPSDICKWFSELFVDASDWATVPSVFGISQFSSGGAATARPYISGSNAILQMSHYERGVWCDVWDGLFWRFIEKHKDRLRSDPRMRVMVQRLGHLDADRRRIISYRAEDFLARVTR